jgi:predicted DNA-binding transcriptional regulator AlpA
MRDNDPSDRAPTTDEAGPCSLTTRLLARYGNGERLLTTEEVAEILQLAPESLGRWRSTGEGPRFVKFGRGRTAPIRYRLTDVLEYVERSVRRSTSDLGPEC